MVVSDILFYGGIGIIGTVFIIVGVFEIILEYYTYRKRPNDNPKYNLAEIALQYLPPDAIIVQDKGQGWYKVGIEGNTFLFNIDTKVLTHL